MDINNESKTRYQPQPGRREWASVAECIGVKVGPESLGGCVKCFVQAGLGDERGGTKSDRGYGVIGGDRGSTCGAEPYLRGADPFYVTHCTFTFRITYLLF